MVSEIESLCILGVIIVWEWRYFSQNVKRKKQFESGNTILFRLIKIMQQCLFKGLVLFVELFFERRSPVTHYLASLPNARPGSASLMWVPGHKWISGNEFADTDANRPPPKTLLAQFIWISEFPNPAQS